MHLNTHCFSCVEMEIFFLNKMTLFLRYFYTSVCLILLLSALCYCQQNFSSRASYYRTNDEMGTTNGACGYGEYGRTTNDGQVCAVSTRLFKNGAGCGACYQVRCKSSGLCSEVGEKVMATDYVEGQETDFILSYRAYTGLAKQPRMAEFLREKGAVDVEFRRVSCNSAAKLRVKIHDNSQYPHYLSILLTNQGGATDIFAVEIYEEETYEWISMRRAFGAVWDLANPPSGELKARFLVSSSAAAKWVESEKAIIPAEWKAGLTIETNIKLN